MATPSKTSGQTLSAWADVASAAVSVGSPVDVSTKLGATVFARLGRGTGSAFTAGWPNIRIEASFKSSGDNSWFPLVTFQPGVGVATLVNTTLSGAVSAGATSFGVTSASNIAVGDILFLGDGTASSNYEIVRVKGVSGTTITPEENVVNAHTSGALVTDQAEIYQANLDLSSIVRIRAVIDNAGSGQAIKTEVTISYLDSIG